MNIELIIGIIQIVLIATTPLVFAGIGELVTEKSGVLNLGVEGMMLVGAVTAFVTLVITGNYFLAFIFSILSGVIMSSLIICHESLLSELVKIILTRFTISSIFIIESHVTSPNKGSEQSSKPPSLELWK